MISIIIKKDTEKNTIENNKNRRKIKLKKWKH